MRVLASLVLAALVVGALLVQGAAAQQVPNVSTLEPFSQQTMYMSLPGYLRWLVFQQTGNWISRAEAERIVRQQAGR
ncbi:MAG: hypothetical protein QN122_05665 [Armatimonadota bacterium]|nr:hypothetical protein [Armatimonadota bacterium]MDR7448267.1 hypothetical protein [Armatimonadota bacterium]MDR7458297.1 hypothetical protein [Armatimonadota bacterium]MDR7478400.1 hypothetical protein [Armatimonadota bacterium]MDR7487334.1 hypothetical protein [Armatimonadota bacterium]